MSVNIKKLYWADVRSKIKKINASLANEIDEISPPDDCFFFEAEFHFGDLLLERGSWYLPTEDGQTLSLADPKMPKKITQALNYNMYTNPVFCVLDKTVECYLDTFSRPYSVFTIKPGELIGLSGVLDGLTPANKIRPLDSIWHMSSGVRNGFIAPKITEAAGNTRLHRHFELSLSKPKSLDDHWTFFREIYRQSKPTWKCKVLMFSRNWFKYLQTKEWRGLKLYFHQANRALMSFWTNTLAWNINFSQIHYLKNINTSSLASNVTKHLMAVGSGKIMGFKPATDESHLPAALLTTVYNDIYEMKEYIPVIMHPAHVNFQQKDPVYVSLQRLNIEDAYLYDNLPSTLKLLDEVQYTLSKYLDAIRSRSVVIDAPYLSQVAQAVKFDFFHSVMSDNKNIHDSTKLKRDKHFSAYKLKRDQKFPRAGKCFRGCVRLTPK